MNENHYRNNNMNNSTSRNNSSRIKRRKSLSNPFNGYDSNMNKYAANSRNADSVRDSLEKARINARKQNARNAVRTGLNSIAPGSGEIADKVMNTEKGNELLDIYSNAENDVKGLAAVAAKLKSDHRKKMTMLSVIAFIVPIFIIVVMLILLFKNGDSQIYSNVNNGHVDDYVANDPYQSSVFSKYPGLYEKIEAAIDEVGDKYKVEADKYLILATLIAPIENGIITPTLDNKCGEPECYYFEGKPYTWEEFLELWGDQAKYLVKAQMLTYVNESSDLDVECGQEETMEQYAMNDLEVNEFNFWALFNPLNWFKGFRDATEAELNAKCIMDVPAGKEKIPTVRVLSVEQGIYYNSINANHERVYEKDPNTGGVYFWNLVNEGGFIHVYMKDYLNVNPNASDSQNYEQNLSTILDIGNYIYSYYESIRKDCENYSILEGGFDTINVTSSESGSSGGSIDFEEQYLGGVLLAEYNSGNLESLKAFAILARSYAVSIVGIDGSGSIENSSNNQNYNPNYSPEKYPNIAEAVEATKGMIVTNYHKTDVVMTEYDAFCPVKNVLEDGFYYLPDGQNRLPINPGAYEAKVGSSFFIPEEYLECPCFQNYEGRPHDEVIDGKQIRFHTSPSSPPTHPGGNPPQETLESCWTSTGHTRVNNFLQTEYGWSYKPSGGHGRGASQYGLKYYGAFEYEFEALIKLFYGDDVVIRKLESSIEKDMCQKAAIYNEDTFS